MVPVVHRSSTLLSWFASLQNGFASVGCETTEERSEKFDEDTFLGTRMDKIHATSHSETARQRSSAERRTNTSFQAGTADKISLRQ